MAKTKLKFSRGLEKELPIKYFDGEIRFCTDTGALFIDNATGRTKIAAGKADTADKLTTARVITLAGDVTGSVSFDGSKAVTITTTVKDDSHNHIISNIDGLQDALDKKALGCSMAAVTPAAAGWYRIAESNRDIGNCLGTFYITGAAPGYHTTTSLIASISYGWYPYITILNCSNYSVLAFTKARIVYHKTYNNNYAYLEVYLNPAIDTSITVNLTLGHGWKLISPNTAGSIPSGYSVVEKNIVEKTFSAEKAIFDDRVIIQTTNNSISPTNQTLVLNGVNNSDSTALAPGIGFHIGQKGWASLKFLSDGSFRFYNNNGTGYQPVYASTFYGNLSGNAATATKATQDGSGNNIVNTYATKATVNTNLAKSITGLSVSGQTITYTKGDGSTGTIKTQDTNTTYTFNGAVSTIKDNNLIANRALISNGSGKVAVSNITSTELGYLSGLTGSIKNSLSNKVPYVGTTPVSGEASAFYCKLCTVTVPKGYYDIYFEFDLVGRTAHRFQTIKCAVTKANTLALNDAKIFVSGNNGNFYEVVGYKNVITSDSVGDTFELWCKVPAYDELNVFHRKVGGLTDGSQTKIQDWIAWEYTKNTALPTESSTKVKVSASLEAWQGNAKTATTATTATKLGTSTVGSTSLPIYLDAGTPKAISSAIPIIYGGTGATTAAGILTNLGITATATELNKLDGITATTTELNYVDGVTSNIQTQLNAKQNTITGAATTVLGSNLLASRALISNSSGKIAVSDITSTELNYLDGVTSNIQTQLNAKLSKSGGTMTGQLTFSGTGYTFGASGYTANYAGNWTAGASAGSWNIYKSDGTTNVFQLMFGNGNIKTPGAVTATGGFVGNASSATKLATKRTINGTDFDGSGNITTSSWGTARTLKIGNKSQSVNGSQDISWSLKDIGAIGRYTEAIVVKGDTNSTNIYYPVVIKLSTSKDTPTYFSIWKDLGSPTPSYEGNHEINGTSSMWIQYEGRNNQWDGNGGYLKTLDYYMGYANLCAKTELGSNGSGQLIIWLRGGGTSGCAYNISSTRPITYNIYYEKTLISGSADNYPVYVEPTTTVGNKGIYSTRPIGYGSLSGNASTATNVAWSGITSKPSYYDAKAIKSITRSGTTFTYTCMDGTTGTFTQQDNNTTYSAATQSAQGLMSAADKKKLDGIAAGANNYTYTLPTASSALGGVKTTSTVTSTSGLTACPIISGVVYYKDTNTTYGAAGTSLGLVKSGGDVTISNGVITVNDDSHNHTILKGNTSSSINMDAANGTMRYDYNIVSTATGLFPTTNNANAIITINRHSGAYDSQLGFSANGKLYYRNFNAVNNDTTTAWKQIAFTDSNVASATKATQDGSGNTITSTYATKTELDTAKSSLQTSINGKANSSHTHTKSQITDFPTSMPASDVYSWAKASTKPSYSWSEITSKPSSFTPTDHTHAYLKSIGNTVANTRTQSYSQALLVGGWGNNDAGYGSTYGTSLDVSGFSTWYHRLAFHTSGEIDYWQGINTNTLTKVGRIITSKNIGSQSVNYATSAGSATKATQDGDGNTITSTYLKLSGGTLSGKLTASGKISVPTSGSAWISGMTTGNASIAISTQNTSGSYHPIIAGKTYNRHIWNLGTYVDNIGFYGFKSGRTENATDWSFAINVSSGAINASGSITAASFHGSGSGLTSLNASNISSGTLAVARGGTGITSNPSMLINLGSTSAANVFATSPRPGITGTLGLANGGTGKTTAKDAANAFINALDIGSSAPVDADYYICQYAGGGTSTITYHRRPTSALWTYMKGKIDTTYYKTVTKSGAIGSVTLADKTDYIYTGVTSLTLVYPSGNFECWLSVTTSTSAITLSFPSGTKFIGASITSLVANTTYEISIKNKVAIIKKVG